MKKLIFAALCLVLVGSCFFSLAACSEKEEPIKIVFLGDSIAEGILGPSPLSERENYGYYALIGRMNNFEYYNRSVSGHKTSQLLRYLKREDESAMRTRYLIQNADILHISILGNDILQSKFETMVVQAAQNKFTLIDSILTGTRADFRNVVETLKEYNPDALIIFQTVYNPGDGNTILVRPETANTLAELGVQPGGYRELTKKLLDRLNGILYEYLEANPGAYIIADVNSAYDNVYKQNRAKGNRLIYPDWVHPSNEGHAMHALVTQKILLEKGYGNPNYADVYRQIRLEQLDRMYKNIPNYLAIRSSIEQAATYEEISAAYFDSIYGKTPDYTGKGEA